MFTTDEPPKKKSSGKGKKAKSPTTKTKKAKATKALTLPKVEAQMPVRTIDEEYDDTWPHIQQHFGRHLQPLTKELASQIVPGHAVVIDQYTIGTRLEPWEEAHLAYVGKGNTVRADLDGWDMDYVFDKKSGRYVTNQHGMDSELFVFVK